MAVYEMTQADPRSRRHSDQPAPPTFGALTAFHGQIAERLSLLRGSVKNARMLADRLVGSQPQAGEVEPKEYGPDCLLAGYARLIEEFDSVIRELNHEQSRIAEAV